MDTTLTKDLTPGRFVVMDDLLWTIDRTTPTAGVYRLLLVHPCVDWPAGQVGFGHATRLRPVDLCPACEDHRPREYDPRGDWFACPCGHSGPTDELVTEAVIHV